MSYGDFCFQPAQLPFHGLQFFEGTVHLGKQRAALMLQTILRQIAESCPFRDLQGAAVGLHQPGQHFQQRRFSGPVFTTESDPISWPDMPVDSGKNRSIGKKLYDLSELQHGAGYSTNVSAKETGSQPSAGKPFKNNNF